MAVIFFCYHLKGGHGYKLQNLIRLRGVSNILTHQK